MVPNFKVGDPVQFVEGGKSATAIVRKICTKHRKGGFGVNLRNEEFRDELSYEIELISTRTTIRAGAASLLPLDK